MTVVGFGSVVAASGPVSAGTAGTAGPSCSSSFNPYAVSMAVLQRCGLKVFPRQSSAKLADGGMQYVYVVDGVRYVYDVPPASLNLAQASDHQLASYGLPARPQDPVGIAAWSQMMGRWHSVTPPAMLVETQNRASGPPACSNCWSGYVAKTSNSSAYNWAEIKYNEPSIGSTTCSNNAAVTWGGIGGDGTSNLAQDGTGINVPGMGQHEGWDEVLPNYMVAQPIWGHPGYAFTAEVNHPGNNTWNFNMWDSYTGAGIQFQAAGGYDGSSVEFIVERPWNSNVGQMWLTKYWYINVLDAYVNGYNPVGNYSPSNWSMYSPNYPYDLLASNGNLFNGGLSFQNNWHNCS